MATADRPIELEFSPRELEAMLFAENDWLTPAMLHEALRALSADGPAPAIASDRVDDFWTFLPEDCTGEAYADLMDRATPVSRRFRDDHMGNVELEARLLIKAGDGRLVVIRDVANAPARFVELRAVKERLEVGDCWDITGVRPVAPAV